jgi:hypothetical protein
VCWDGGGLLDGAASSRLAELEGLLLELAYRLNEAESGAAYGPGPDLERVVGRPGRAAAAGGIDAKSPARDDEVKQLKKLRSKWMWKLRRLVKECEADLYESHAR